MKAGRRGSPWHITRMVPRRSDEVLDGGSIYWVIDGQIQCRQSVAAIEPFEDGEGIRRCRLVLDASLIPTMRVQRRPFQGWRYLDVKEAPIDLPDGVDPDALQLLRELDALGLT